MRHFVALLLVLSSAFAPSGIVAQQPASPTPTPITVASITPAALPAPNTLLDGTAIKLRLSENLSSAIAKTGQSVSFEVTEDVSVQGVVVLAKGAQALATVTDAATKRAWDAVAS